VKNDVAAFHDVQGPERVNQVPGPDIQAGGDSRRQNLEKAPVVAGIVADHGPHLCPQPHQVLNQVAADEAPRACYQDSLILPVHHGAKLYALLLCVSEAKRITAEAQRAQRLMMFNYTLTYFHAFFVIGKISGHCQGKKNRQEGGEMGEVSCRRGGGKSSNRVFPFSRIFPHYTTIVSLNQVLIEKNSDFFSSNSWLARE
jgi:hypothetical protein